MNNLLLGMFGALTLFAAPALAQDEAPPPRSYLLVELLGPAKMIGYPAICPGSSPDEDQLQIICMAELYEAPARVIQHLGGAETEQRLNIRFTAHSFSAVWQKDVRFLLSVFPFEDKGRTGHFAASWEWENDRGEFCVSAEHLDDLEPPIRDFYAAGRIRKASARDEDWEQGYKIACAKGRRARAR